MTYLGRKVESQVAVVRETIFDKQGHFAGEGELDFVGQPAGLAEVCEILQGEGERHRLGQVNRNILFWFIYVVGVPEVDGSRADVTLASELDAFFGALNSN
jgi:hypothetical protein